jgi:hypothetical protein
VSPSKARVAGGQRKFLPVALEEDFRPSEADMDFAERFRMIASAIDACENAELVALLLSTCRNQWMAVNGMFVDLQEILGASKLPDLASRGFHNFAEGDASKAGASFSEALRFSSALAQKLRCWHNREKLLAQLEEAIAAPDRSRLERHHLEAWLLRQSHGPSIPGRIRQAQYLRLDQSDGHCPQLFELIDRTSKKLAAALRIAHRISRVSALAADSDRHEPPEQLFDLDLAGPDADPDEERDLQAEHEGKLQGAWEKLREAILDYSPKLGFMVSEETNGVLVLESRDSRCFEVDREISEEDAEALVEELPPALQVLISRAQEVVEEIREQIFEAFTLNVATPPMPAPFVVDLTPSDPASSEERVRAFSIHAADGRHHTPDTAKLALLRCGMPGSAFSTARKGHIAYDPNENEGARKAKQIALAAVEKAKAVGASFLAMPEVFLPRNALKDVRKAAEDAGIGLIAGLEYPERHGGPINEVLVQVPDWDEPIFQRKQGPSVEELNHTAFESTLDLFFVRRTALGNIGIVVCSDFMELDLMWGLASFDDKLDVLIVCARNYRPEIFERIAIADAFRLHALVAVVNSWVPRPEDKELPSGKGTLVAQPNSEQPLLELEQHLLPVEWEGQIEQPSIALASLNIADIRDRDLERPGAHGYISPPRFVADARMR